MNRTDRWRWVVTVVVVGRVVRLRWLMVASIGVPSVGGRRGKRRLHGEEHLRRWSWCTLWHWLGVHACVRHCAAPAIAPQNAHRSCSQGRLRTAQCRLALKRRLSGP